MAIADALLREMAKSVDEIADRFRHVLQDGELFKAYSPHHEYPRPNMDKFVIYMDPEEKFRVRVHKFQRRRDNIMVTPHVHDHRWCISSLILSGAYTEKKYRIVEFDQEAGRAVLALDKETVFAAGDVNSVLSEIPHSATNDSDHEDCYTLFVRGKSIVRNARVFELKTHTYHWAHGFKDALLNQARLFAQTMQAQPVTGREAAM